MLIPHHHDRKIEEFVMSRRYLTIFCRKNGLQTAFVYIVPHDIENVRQLRNSIELKFEEAVFSLRPGRDIRMLSPQTEKWFSRSSRGF